jgi:hypothetical protein
MTVDAECERRWRKTNITESKQAEEEGFAKVANIKLSADSRVFVFAIHVLFFNKMHYICRNPHVIVIFLTRSEK